MILCCSVLQPLWLLLVPKLTKMQQVKKKGPTKTRSVLFQMLLNKCVWCSCVGIPTLDWWYAWAWHALYRQSANIITFLWLYTTIFSHSRVQPISARLLNRFVTTRRVPRCVLVLHALWLVDVYGNVYLRVQNHIWLTCINRTLVSTYCQERVCNVWEFSSPMELCE